MSTGLVESMPVPTLRAEGSVNLLLDMWIRALGPVCGDLAADQKVAVTLGTGMERGSTHWPVICPLLCASAFSSMEWGSGGLVYSQSCSGIDCGGL